MMKNKRTIFIAAVVFFALPFLFQNCSDVSVNSMPSLPPPPVEVPLGSMTANVCSPSETTVTYNSKIIFIVDMSLSNLGGRNEPEPCMISSIPLISGWYHSLGPQSGAYDYNGIRFQILRDFSTTLGTDAVKNLSIMGFHDSSVFGLGLESCQSEFLNKSDALTAINYLNTLQNQDKAYPGGCKPSYNSPFNLKGTKYQVALSCLQDKIDYDLLAGEGTEKSAYNVIFLTDGQPEDTDNFPQFLTNLKNRIGSEILGMKLYPVYYGPLGGAEEATAVSNLDPMAHVFDASISTVVTNNLSTITGQLLSELATTTKVQFTLKNFSAINLTAANDAGQLKADSNMNGSPDSASAQGQTIREIFEQYKTNLNQDGDGYPSFLEAVKGLNVDIADFDIDTDLDGMSNGLELAAGRDIFTSDLEKPTVNQYLVKSTVEVPAINTCQQSTAYNFKVQQMPVVQGTMGFQDPSPGSGIDFSYAAGENLIMLYFIAEPLNSSGFKKRMYVSFLKVPENFSGQIDVSNQSFKLLGEFE